MEFRGDCLIGHFSSRGRAGFIQLDVSRFHEVYSVCRDIFIYFNQISVEELDQGFIINVKEEWLQDEDLLILTIEPRVVGQIVPEEVGVAVDVPRWGEGEPNIGFPRVPRSA